jgi:hypothetical protein
MMSPQVADGEGSFQLWKVAANKFNEQLWTVDSVRSITEGIGLSTPFTIKCSVTKPIH